MISKRAGGTGRIKASHEGFFPRSGCRGLQHITSDMYSPAMWSCCLHISAPGRHDGSEPASSTSVPVLRTWNPRQRHSGPGCTYTVLYRTYIHTVPAVWTYMSDPCCAVHHPHSTAVDGSEGGEEASGEEQARVRVRSRCVGKLFFSPEYSYLPGFFAERVAEVAP